jgi:urease gamma subunit
MAFIRIGSRLANGSRSGAYVYADGEMINIHVAAKSAARRRGGSHVKLTYEEVIAIAKSCVNRGWVKSSTTAQKS